MITFIYPEKNCTLYSLYDILNTGSDEIMEILSDYNDKEGAIFSRILIKFSDEDILSNYDFDNQYLLNLKILQSIELEYKSSLEVFPVSQSWEEGRGRFSDMEYVYPGASWLYRNEERDTWSANDNIEYELGGGSWFSSMTNELEEETTDIDLSFSFEKNTSDVTLDITSLIRMWVNNDIENNGLIIKFRDEDKSNLGNVKFFSRNTNTIYSPFLSVGKLDYKFDPYVNVNISTNYETRSNSLDSGSLNSGSLNSESSGSLDSGSLDIETESLNKISDKITEVDGTDLNISIKDIRESYSKSSKEQLRVGVRKLYPVKDFSKRMRYTTNNITKKDLFYSVIDAETEEVLIDFSNYTKISCDSDGHYFNFDFNCLNRGRIYKFSILIEDSVTRKKFTDERTFMIVN